MILIACSIFLCINSAITWENTNELQNALYVYDITVGLNGYIYAGTKIDSTSLDCGRVFVSQDMWNWQRCSGVPWVVEDTIEGVYALMNGAGDTLFAGTGVYHSDDVPRIHKSSDGGATWSSLNSYGTYRVGSRVCALLEDNLGTLHLGNNYWGMSAASPRYSTDRGNTWELPTGLSYNSGQYYIFQSSDNTLYFGAWSDYIHRSTDNGVTWAATTPPVNISDCFTLIEAGTDTIFAGTGADIGRLFMTTDQGNNWVEKGDGYFNSTTAIRSLLYASDGAIYAGTSPNAEVFVSIDKGDTWISTGVLSGANTVYRFIESTKTGIRQDSTFLFAATGPNGDVFRGLLFVIGIYEEENIIDNSIIPQVSCKTPVRDDFMLLNISVNNQRPAELNILNATGAVVHNSNHRLKQGNNSLKITMNGFSQGIYFICLDMGEQYIIRKVVHLK
ncbi:MAG: T9SS type A sorting domain-containing protein [bacterium]